MKPPSAQALLPRMQDIARQGIACSRPPAADAIISVTLFHCIFRQFVDDCKNHQPTRADNALVRGLSDAMSRFFSDEAANFRGIMHDHNISLFGSEIHSKGQTFFTHGDIQVDGHRFIIAQFTNEVGRGGGTEPYTQAVLDYTHSMWLEAKRFLSSNFPCSIITVFSEDAPP